MFDSTKAGKQIALLRRRKGLTQEELASLLQVSPQAVSKWETGKAMPELSLLAELAKLLESTIDGIVFPCSVPSPTANFEHILLPYASIAEFTGNKWPCSMAKPAIYAAVKLLMGLENHRDSRNQQINDGTEYILQSAFSSICFGYSWEPENDEENCLAVYGLTSEIYSKANCSEEEYIRLAINNILSGYPVIVRPKEYTDTILATGFSDRGKNLKGIPFLDGDDDKNCTMSFEQLQDFSGWYVKDSDLILIKASPHRLSVSAACKDALRKGFDLLHNQKPVSDQPLVGHGLIIYDNWCSELRKENNRKLMTLECVFPHIFIHYEGKLRIRQFLELCLHLIDGVDSAPLKCAIAKYSEIVSMCEKNMHSLLSRTPESAEEAEGMRQVLIGILQRSKELETEALTEISQIITDL